ncbi:MAG TPA: PP2C family protein-serine/threonine phosphatase [Terracidiphilus sp.]|nr:PP2C family protein-serine/threonine phosphatase [Terracidiphilus sp.]
MFALEAQLTAGEVLRAFHHDEPFLFLGAAFNTVTIILIGLCIIRRKADGMLLSLACFAHLYGIRLWINSDLLRLSIPASEFFHRFSAAVDYLVPVPAFIFFYFAGFLGKAGRFVAPIFVVLFLGLSAGSMLFGTHAAFRDINNTVIAVALIAVALRWFRRMAHDRDSRVIGVGLLCFVLPSISDNVYRPSHVEPYGFAVLLACLGYVAAHRALQRDKELDEIQQELDLARRMQLSILPGDFPASRSFRVAAKYVPMTSVAGDLYDFLLADDQHAGLLIADVSGHGVPAALIASMVKMAAISQRAQTAHPAVLLSGMNSALCGNTQGQYVTAAYVYLDAHARELHYAAAGHPAMLLLRNGAVTEIAENGMLLAAVPGANYESRSLPLESGDRLLLYTDGVIEARNAEGRLFGEQSLAAELKTSARMTPSETADHLIGAVQAWAKSQDDDLTVLVCDFMGSPALAAAD